MAIWFVYRSHYEGPLSRRIRRLEATSILDWFARKIADAKRSKKPEDVASKELGGDVYGLASLFEEAKAAPFEPPKTLAKLRALLDEHLYAEGDIRLDAHTLRVKTDDDEVDLAYYFFDDAAANKHAARLSFLLLDKPKLPGVSKAAAAKPGKFKPPVEIEALAPAGTGEGTTYACLLTFNDSESMPGAAHAFAGVRMPELCAYLRSVTPFSKPSEWSPEYTETWPFELRLLRAMVDPKDTDVAAALERCSQYPMAVRDRNVSGLGVGSAALARTELKDAAKGVKHAGSPKKSIVHATPHAALLCVHATSAFGFQQWILFDDVWAAANKDLASSILRYATGWDPFTDGDDDDDDDD